MLTNKTRQDKISEVKITLSILFLAVVNLCYSQSEIRVNAGGGATTYLGKPYIADTYYTPASTSTTGIDVANQVEPYQSIRYNDSDLSYDIPVRNGDYQVVLHFIENFWADATFRRFHIDLEGNRVATDFDINYEAGGRFIPISRTYNNVSVSDGTLSILLTKTIKDNPSIAAIEVISTSSQELYTSSNAAGAINEQNTTNGWSGNVSFSATNTQVYSGNYALEILATTDGWRSGDYTFSTTPGEQYRIVMYAKHSSVRAGFWLWEGFSDFEGQDITGSDWSRYEFNVTASGSEAKIKAFPGHPSVAGDVVYLDHISIVNVNNVNNGDSQNPTAPSLSSTGNSASTVNLSWTGATDNIGVTGYRVYQGGVSIATLGNVSTYTANGLTEATPYNFAVTALDAAGNESVASNSVTVTTDSGSGGGGTTGNDVWTTNSGAAIYSGKVGIGVTTVQTNYQLAVNGTIRSKEIRVEQSNWPDYVFAEGYDLPTLKEIQEHIQEKGHLPNIPSAQEVKTNGIELGEMNKLLLEKIEELTLHILIQQKQLKEQDKRINDLEKNAN